MAVAVVAAAVIAEAAVIVLRPRRGLLEPVHVAAKEYFSPAQIERAQRFRYGQLGILLVGLAVEGAVLAILVARPRRLEQIANRLAVDRVNLGVAVAGAGLVLLLEVVGLPFAAAQHERAVQYGLVTQGWGGWFEDQAKSVAIGGSFAAVGAAVFGLLMRRFRRHWWLPASGVVVGFGVLFTLLSPVVVDPLFNRYKVLASGPARADVLSLARRAGVRIGEVYVVDASRRTTGHNAYVTGLGPTKRVVLYDNLLREFTPAETRLVVAHELGHVGGKDVWRGVLFMALIAPAGMFAVQRLTEALARRGNAAIGTPGSLPALALSLAIVSFGGQVVGNQLSRRVEARADTYALELTDEPDAAIDMERRLAIGNLANPDPPRALVWLFGTHPPTVERIGAALAYERRRR